MYVFSVPVALVVIGRVGETDGWMDDDGERWVKTEKKKKRV